MQNFHAILRAELLDRELSFHLEEVQVMADEWREVLMELWDTCPRCGTGGKLHCVVPLRCIP